MNKDIWKMDVDSRKAYACSLARGLINDSVDFLDAIRDLSELEDALDYGDKLFSTFSTIDKVTYHLPPSKAEVKYSDNWIASTNIEKEALKKKYNQLVIKKAIKIIETIEQNT